MTYGTHQDPYCYPNSTVLRNIRNLTNQADLDQFETVMTSQRMSEILPSGRFSVTYYRNLHHHLFQDVYAWAGKYRTIRISKGESMFCYPEHIDSQMRDLFAKLKTDANLQGLPPEEFAPALAAFLSTLNAIHPFREGNGRTQLIFIDILAQKAGHQLNLDNLDPKVYLAASIAAFKGDEAPLASFIFDLL